MVSEYANTSKSVKVANKIKKQRDVTIPRLALWNYDACEHHDTPRADCEYRKCGNDFFSHQRVTIAWLYAIKKGLLASSPGTGKAQPLSSKILTPSGWKTMGDMQVGSEVLTPEGSKSRVVAVYPQGVQPIYKITFNDGSSTRATGDHLWRVRARGQWRTVTTESILHGTKQPLDSGRMLPVSPIVASDGRLTYTIPSTTLNTPDVPLTLPPYLLGALLGDGGFKSSHVSITSMDEELIGKVRDLASQVNTKLVFVANSGKAKTYLFVRESAEVTYNPIRKELKNMGLLGAGSRDKFIPTQYLHASYSQRLELLRGLMDTDGSRDTTNEFSSVSYALAHGVASLVRSLGGYAYLRERNTSWTHNGAKKTGTCWRVSFNIPVNPFGTSAHSDLYTGPGQKQRRVVSIVPDGVEEAQCILIDHSDHLYITDDYIVTHNTNCILGTLCLLKEKNEMPRRAIIVVNTPSVKQWAAEAARFAPGLRVEAVVGGTKKSERVEAYGGTWDVLIVGFHMMLRDMELLRKIKPSVVMTDDVDPLLNDTTKVHKALVELTEDVDRVVISNASSVGTDLIQIHSSMMPIGGKYIWGPKDMFENNFIQKEWEKVQVGTEVYYNKQGDRISKPKYVSKSKVRGVKNAPQPVDCPVLTPSGWRPMGDISVGDFVIGSSGHPVKVIGKTGVTNEPVYKVHLSQGQWAEATADHLWAVEQLQVLASHQNRMRVVKTKDLMGRKKGYCLPLYGGFYSGTYKASVSPYLMGVLLGDGTISDGKCGFTTGSHSDESLSLLGQVFNEVDNKNFWRVQESTDKASVFVSLSTPRGMRPRTAPDVCACGRPAFTKSRSLCASCYQIAWQKDRLLSAEKARAYIDPLIAGLRAEGVYGYVKENKKFPWQMLHASYEDRLALLQGLMDSDGTMIQDRGRATFTNRSKDLSDGVASLAQSFGLGFSRWEFINSAGNLCYGVHVSIKKAHPLFRLPYKLEAQMKSHEPYTSRSSRIVSVEYSRDADVQCLMLDSEDHLYVTKDYMLTHNSTFKKTLNPWFIRYTYDDISDVAMPEVAPVTNVWLDMHPEQRKRYDELRQGILKLLADGQEEIKEVQALQIFLYGQMLTAGLPVLGDEDGPGKSVKFDWLCKQMRGDWADEKVICFVRNKKAIAALKDRFAKLGIGAAEVSGNKVGDERQEEITRFWEDPNCRIIFCSAAGVRSLNLQCARIVCFLDIPSLNPESVHQAVGRARRAGGHSKVYPFFLLCNDTQEDHYEEVLQQRETISRWVWDSEDHLLPKMSAQEILRLIMP